MRERRRGEIQKVCHWLKSGGGGGGGNCGGGVAGECGAKAMLAAEGGEAKVSGGGGRCCVVELGSIRSGAPSTPVGAVLTEAEAEEDTMEVFSILSGRLPEQGESLPRKRLRRRKC